MIPSKARTEIHNAICENYPSLIEWYKNKSKQYSIPIYSSYDIRDGDFKVSNVDANIYPAGFNNICPNDKEPAPDLFKSFITAHYGNTVKKILLLTEEHTNNPYYLENVWTIKNLLNEAGYDVKIAFPSLLENNLQLTSSTGHLLDIISGYENTSDFQSFNPDLIISNNDFSMALSDWAGQLTKPLNPPRELGWYQRKKSRYFENYNSLVNEFSKIINIDPFLFRVETELFSDFDINDENSRKQLAERVDNFLKNLQTEYDKRGLQQKAFCFVKNNAGTYGLAVVRVSSGQDVLEWTYKARKKMKAAKGGRDVEEVIIQEGIPSIVTAEEASAEPVIYMIGSELAGGFLRSHPDKNSTESLNSPGAVYKRLCVSDLAEDHTSCPRENVYGWSAKLGLLAIGQEARQMGVEFKNYKS